MTADKQYLSLLDEVLEYGVKKEDRTGVGTISTFGLSRRYKLSEDTFPLLTTKKMNWHSIVSELLWFLEGSTDERRLAEIRYSDDRLNLADKKTIWTANYKSSYWQASEAHFLMKEEYPEANPLGNIYGYQWRNFHGIDQIRAVINSIKKDPHGRRHIVSAWNPPALASMALPPCHILFQFWVDDKNNLSCGLTQRSADSFLGVPYNIASYALLTHMIANELGMGVGNFVHYTGDTHIYLNHLDAVNEQLSREEYASPKLILPKGKPVLELTMSDIVIENYECHPHIKAEMAT